MLKYFTVDWFWILLPLAITCSYLTAAFILMRRSNCVPSKLAFTGAIIALVGVSVNSIYTLRFELYDDFDWIQDHTVQNVFMLSSVGDLLGHAVFAFGLIMFALGHHRKHILSNNLNE